MIDLIVITYRDRPVKILAEKGNFDRAFKYCRERIKKEFPDAVKWDAETRGTVTTFQDTPFKIHTGVYLES